jgi:hypothetical protein
MCQERQATCHEPYCQCVRSGVQLRHVFMVHFQDEMKQTNIFAGPANCTAHLAYEQHFHTYAVQGWAHQLGQYSENMRTWQRDACVRFPLSPIVHSWHGARLVCIAFACAAPLVLPYLSTVRMRTPPQGIKLYTITAVPSACKGCARNTDVTPDLGNSGTCQPTLVAEQHRILVRTRGDGGFHGRKLSRLSTHGDSGVPDINVEWQWLWSWSLSRLSSGSCVRAQVHIQVQA